MNVTNNIVISLFDYTGEALRPWAAAGYECIAFDVQHDASGRVDERGIKYIHADLSTIHRADSALRAALGDEWRDRVVFVLGWPPCTDLAVSGARWWARKAQANPRFQHDAVEMAKVVSWTGYAAYCPWVLENPVGALSTLWRAPDYTFDPCQYGGYIPAADAVHPTWPEYIPPRDAYRKRTCYWAGNGFVMPPTRPVEPEIMADSAGRRGSRQWKKLGGKSQRTKNIRSATPRGIAIAIQSANT